MLFNKNLIKNKEIMNFILSVATSSSTLKLVRKNVDSKTAVGGGGAVALSKLLLTFALCCDTFYQNLLKFSVGV